MAALRVGVGDVQVSLSDDFEQLIRAALDQALPGAVQVVEDVVDRVWRQAVERSPVRTGKFQSGLQHALIVAPDYASIRGRVWDDVEYARFVKSPQLPGSGSAFVELLRKPLEAERERLVAELRAVLEREL